MLPVRAFSRAAGGQSGRKYTNEEGHGGEEGDEGTREKREKREGTKGETRRKRTNTRQRSEKLKCEDLDRCSREVQVVL